MTRSTEDNKASGRGFRRHKGKASKGTKSSSKQAEETSSDDIFQADFKVSKEDREDLVKLLRKDDFKIPGYTIATKENIDRIAELVTVFNPHFNNSMTETMENQMLSNRKIRERLSQLQLNDSSGNLFAPAVLTTTLDEHFDSCGVVSHVGMTFYKAYCLIRSTDLVDALIPLEIKHAMLVALSYVKENHREQVYGTKEPWQFRGLERSSDHAEDLYAIDDEDTRDINQLVESMLTRIEPGGDCAQDDDRKDEGEESKAAAEQSDESLEDDSQSVLTTTSTSTSSRNHNKSRQRVLAHAYGYNTRSINEVFRPKGGTKSHTLSKVGQQTGVTYDLSSMLKHELANLSDSNVLLQDQRGNEAAREECKRMEEGRNWLAERTACAFFETFFDNAIRQDVCTFVALYIAYQRSGIVALTSICERGLLAAIELMSDPYPVPASDKFGYNGMTQRLWQLGMNTVYESKTRTQNLVSSYVDGIINSKDQSIQIQRNLDQDGLLDAIGTVIASLKTISDVRRFTSAQIGSDQLVDIMVKTFHWAFGATADNTVAHVLNMFIEAYNEIMRLKLAEAVKVRLVKSTESPDGPFSTAAASDTAPADGHDPHSAQEAVEAELTKQLALEYLQMPVRSTQRRFKLFLRDKPDLQTWLQATEMVHDELHKELAEANRGSTSSSKSRQTGKQKTEKPPSSNSKSSSTKADLDSRLGDAAQVFGSYVQKNTAGMGPGKSHGICHRHLRQRWLKNSGSSNAHYNISCRDKLLKAAEASKGLSESEMEARMSAACRGMVDKNKPGDHSYTNPMDVEKGMMDHFISNACHHCNRTAILVFEGTTKPPHGIWIGHSSPKSSYAPQCPADGNRSSKDLSRRNGLIVKWDGNVESGKSGYMTMSEVNEFWQRYHDADTVVAVKCKVTNDGKDVSFESYTPKSSTSSTSTVASTAWPPTAAADDGTAQPLAAQLAQQKGLNQKQEGIIADMTRQLNEMRNEIALLRSQMGSQASPTMSTDWGATNEKFDKHGAVTVPVFITETPVQDGSQANQVLLNANVQSQQTKTVYPINMVRSASMKGPLDQATWNPKFLDDQQRLEEEYMVFFSSQPRKAVRMHLKDIILNDSS